MQYYTVIIKTCVSYCLRLLTGGWQIRDTPNLQNSIQLYFSVSSFQARYIKLFFFLTQFLQNLMLIAKSLMRWKNTDNLIQIFTNRFSYKKTSLMSVILVGKMDFCVQFLIIALFSPRFQTNNEVISRKQKFPHSLCLNNELVH
jgi:hypothetical protein